MRVLGRTGIGETVASLTCVMLMLAVLVAFDARVHERFEALVARTSTEGLAPWGDRAEAFVDAVVQAARDRSIDQAPLLVFAVIGGALLVFMLKT